MPGDPRPIFVAHAARLRCCGLRSPLTHLFTHLSMRALRCSAAPSSRTTWTPNLSPRPPSTLLRLCGDRGTAHTTCRGSGAVACREDAARPRRGSAPEARIPPADGELQGARLLRRGEE